MVTSGAGILVYNDKSYELVEGACVFIDCRKSYSHETGDKFWTLCWIHFNSPMMDNIYEKYCERGGRPVFVPDDLTPFFAVWEDVMATAESSNYIRDILINQHLSTLLTLLMNESWHPEDQIAAKKKASVINVKNYLDSNYEKKICLDELSAQFFIDKYYLAKLFKEQFGVTINVYLQNIRITRAKQLLRFSSKTIEEIGYEVGIGAPAYFSRIFKNIEGISPKQFREQW